MNYQALLTEAEQYVEGYYTMHHDADLMYHDLQHTRDVVAAATRLANHYKLNDEDQFTVLAAAWFHDTGYFTDKGRHEARSAEMAAEFLEARDVPAPVITRVAGCIAATVMPQHPEGLLQQIICDADLYHLGAPKFNDRSKLLRRELKKYRHQEIDKEEWRLKSIELLESHKYFTDYARELLEVQKAKNLNKLKKRQQKVVAMVKPLSTAENDLVEPEGTIENVKRRSKKDRPEKGIETMFRITSGNNQRLSDMADRKAHILITVNSIILSAIISLVLKKLDESGFLTIPSFILLIVSLLSMIFSILSTRPTIPEGTFTTDDVEQKRVNLLFFGNFYRMSLDDYATGMIEVMNDIDFLYGTLIKDVYSQGVVLGRKYRLLRAAYNIFMFGLIVAVIAFVIASVIHNGAAAK